MLQRAIIQTASRSSQRAASTLTSAEFQRKPQNEPILDYKRGSSERKELETAIDQYWNTTTKVPLVINGKKVDGEKQFQVSPYEHSRKIAEFSHASVGQINEAIEAAVKARAIWQNTPLKERTAVLYRAADLCATKYRAALNATTIIGQGKTIVQAEIDAACELIDFLRFAAHFAEELQHWDPISTKDSTNKLIYRAMEGFIASISPFNFTAIGGNLGIIPTVMGNGVVWKPSDTAILSNYIIYQILEEAGMPAGICNFVPSDGPTFGDTVTKHKELAAINFTGSVPTFQWLWKRVGERLENYQSFPRLVGECGGKNFHFIHPSADVDTVAPASLRAAFEYQGQKCSALGRMYVPESLWPSIKEKMIAIHAEMKMGPAHEDGIFVSAVIDANAFKRISGHIEHAKNSSKHEIIAGGVCYDSVGYFVQPTIIKVEDPTDMNMTKEIFGPVLPIYVYPDSQVDRVLDSIKDATEFGLTGAVFSQDKDFLYSARDRLKDAVGNLYLNDKSTGSVVCQQPFGGARHSGTNDKAGGPHYNLRWASPQTIKETHVAQTGWKYPYME